MTKLHFALVAIVLSTFAHAQAPPQTPPPAPRSAYQPSPAQLEKLDALQARLKRAVDAFNKASGDLGNECKAVAQANKWPAETICRISDPSDMLSPLVFEQPAKAETQQGVKPKEPIK